MTERIKRGRYNPLFDQSLYFCLLFLDLLKSIKEALEPIKLLTKTYIKKPLTAPCRRPLKRMDNEISNTAVSKSAARLILR